MAFTRFHDDPHRIQKKIDEIASIENYYLNKPGNGVNMPFQMDPQIRLQGWGANLHTNAIELESDFRGLSRPLNRDIIKQNEYSLHMSDSNPYIYQQELPFIDETRSTHPAWMYRDLEQSRWEHPWLNPQNNFELPMNTNVQTRILEKDSYVPEYPNVSNVERNDFYFNAV
jgi:hypothetical protein